MTDRTCGSCYACCVWLGIDELKKWPGQSCKKLDGTHAEKRCTIYENRPYACKSYKCTWLMGIGYGDQRPDQSGLLVTTYDTGSTVIVCDRKKAGHLTDQDSQINRMVASIFSDTIVKECRIVYYDTKHILILKKSGQLYQGKMLKSDSYEDLKMIQENKPLATIRLVASNYAKR